jgi:hypothetical protein
MDGGVTKSLELRYARPVPASTFRYLTSHYVSANGLLDPTVKPFVDAFNTFYVSMAPGNRYRLDYRGGSQSLTLSAWRGPEGPLPEQPDTDKGGCSGGWLQLGELQCGAQAAEAILSVWFGAIPFSPRMKADLLGGRCDLLPARLS